MTAVGFEPTPLRNGALSHRLRPLGQTVLARRLAGSRLRVEVSRQPSVRFCAGAARAIAVAASSVRAIASWLGALLAPIQFRQRRQRWRTPSKRRALERLRFALGKQAAQFDFAFSSQNRAPCCNRACAGAIARAAIAKVSQRSWRAGVLLR